MLQDFGARRHKQKFLDSNPSFDHIFIFKFLKMLL